MTKSAKLKVLPGVLGAPNPPRKPGVMCEDGSGVDLQGGVEGGAMTVEGWGMLERFVMRWEPMAGDGDVARYINRSAPSSGLWDVRGVRDQDTWLM